MIRVLQISDSLKQRFGITAFLMNYNSAIDTNRVVFDYLIIDTEPEIEERIKSLGGEIYYMPKLGLTNISAFNREISSFFNSHHYEIVHSHFYQIDPIVKKIAFKNGTKHYISHSHNTKYADSKLRAIRNCIMSYPIRFTSTDYCGCSQMAGDFLFGKAVLQHRGKALHVVPNAIDYGKFLFNAQTRDRIRREYNICNKTVYGNIGSLKPQKNHMFLLDVFKQICLKEQDSVLMIVGGGELENTIKQKAQDIGLEDKLIMVGTTDHPQDYYNAFDCYVFPSKYEGFGLSLLEAQVNGIPCVCSDVVPDEPIVSERVRRISLNKSTAKWAEICIDESTYGRINKKIMEKYNISKAAEALIDYYEGLIVW